MRNQRSRGNIRVKKGKEYTIRRIAILAILIFIILAFLKALFFPQDSSEERISKTENSTSEKATNSITDKNEINNNSINSTEVQDEDISFSMAVTGDIMCHNTNYMDAYNSSTKSYDFSHYFTDIKKYLQEADITVGNLETTFAGAKRGYSGYPTFNTPEILAKNLKSAGFNVVSTANNHCMDKGFTGLTSTIDFLDEADIAHTGTFKTKKDQETILIQTVKGVKIAFLSFTYGTNGIPVPKDKSFAVNLIDKDLMKKQINLAKEEEPDLICVSMHWGIEYQTKANKEQEDLAEFLFENGVDVILGNHSHVPQQMEKKEFKMDDGTKKDVFVIYSLGNFMANQNMKYTNDSAILNITFTKHKDTGKMSIDKVTYTPTYMFKNTARATKKFKILDIRQEIKLYESKSSNAVSRATYNILKTELKNIERIIGDEIK